jgi:hypothetical protein
MPLTAGAQLLPSQPAIYATPFDAQLAFTLVTGQNLTATGDFNNGNTQLDLGGFASGPGGAPGSGVGRCDGIWILNVTAVDFSSGDETYKLHLLGSNDVAFGNGNVELLAFHDLAAASAGRQIATLLGPSLAAPTRIYRPFTNLSQGILFRYVRMRLVAAGTTPSITLVAWLSRDGVAF